MRPISYSHQDKAADITEFSERRGLVHLNGLNWDCANTHVTWAMWQPLNEKSNIALPSPPTLHFHPLCTASIQCWVVTHWRRKLPLEHWSVHATLTVQANKNLVYETSLRYFCCYIIYPRPHRPRLACCLRARLIGASVNEPLSSDLNVNFICLSVMTFNLP